MNLTPEERAICAKIAMEITEHPERWTQAAYARDAAGRAVSAHDTDAICWCALGMIHKHAEANTWERIARAFSAAAYRGSAEVGFVDNFNDAEGRTAPEVAVVFSKLSQEQS